MADCVSPLESRRKRKRKRPYNDPLNFDSDTDDSFLQSKPRKKPKTNHSKPDVDLCSTDSENNNASSHRDPLQSISHKNTQNTRKTKKKKKKKKKDANWWIKSDQNKHDPSAPATFSRHASILKLKQIATVSKMKQKPKQKTLIDIIYESDSDEDPLDAEDESDTNNDTLMEPIFDRRLCVSADSGMSELVNARNAEIKEQQQNGDAFWMKTKKKKKKNQTAQELLLLFDFRDFENQNTRRNTYRQSIENIQSEQAEQAIQLMKQKTFNAVKLKQEIKQKAIEGFTVRLEVQKKLIKEGFSSVPILSDDDFVKSNAHANGTENDQGTGRSKLNKRDMLTQALKDEDMAMAHCAMIVEELGFLKYVKDDETYRQLVKAQQNAIEKGSEMKDDTDVEESKAYDLLDMTNSNLLLSLKNDNTLLLMRIVSRSLVVIQSLRFIELCNCGVDDYFLSQICLQLLGKKDEFKINTLSLQSNVIGDNGMLCLCELMKANNEYLKVIKLQNNRKDISTSVCQEICTALEINDFVVKFEFEFRHYGEKDRSYRALKKNIEKVRIQRVANKNQALSNK
eukprot:265791_1